jgi:hypothetical protein
MNRFNGFPKERALARTIHETVENGSTLPRDIGGHPAEAV